MINLKMINLKMIKTFTFSGPYGKTTKKSRNFIEGRKY